MNTPCVSFGLEIEEPTGKFGQVDKICQLAFLQDFPFKLALFICLLYQYQKPALPKDF